MKTTLYKSLLILLLVPAISFATTNSHRNNLRGKHTREKKITKKFEVGARDLLKIDNSYGNVDITTWDENTVSIEVFIKTNGNDEEKVQSKLDEISVDFNQGSGVVSAKTRFKKENSSWWENLFSMNSNVNMEINYIIKAPRTNNVELYNDYGNIYLDKLTGNSKISCDYGKIEIGELRGDKNYISFDYSRNSHFGYIESGVINADYSEFNIEEAGSLDIQADYTDSNVRKVEYIKYSCDYGSMTIDKLKKLSGNGDYLTTKIGQIFQSADINSDYGSLSIDRIVKGAGTVKIEADYTGVKIGYAENHPFSFQVDTSYGSVSGMDDLQVQKQNNGNTSKSYSGYHLNSSGGGNIIVSTSYGRVNFSRN